MEEQSIEYTIDIVDNVEFDVSKEPRFENDTNPIVIYYWKYIVLNNIGYPTTTIKAQVGKQGTYDNPPELPNPFVDIPLYQSQSKNILDKQFYGPSTSRAIIPGKSYKNKKYPKGGELKSSINPQPIFFTAKVVDETTNQGISGVSVKNNPTLPDLPDQETTTDSDGSFTVQTKGGKDKIQKLTFNVKKYESTEITISTQNGSISSNTSIIPLTPNSKSLNSSILKSKGNTDDQNQEIINFGKLKEGFVSLTVKTLQFEVKQRLLPFIIKKLLCTPYGICNPIGLIEKAKLAKEKNDLKGILGSSILSEAKKLIGNGLTCPPNIQGLNEIINLKNKLTKQLNKLQNGLNSITDFITTLNTIVSTSKKSIPPLKATVAATSFIPSTSITPIPVGPILIAKDAIKILDDLIDITSPKLEISKFQLGFLKGEIKKVIDLLSLVDLITSLCASELSNNSTGTLTPQTSVSNELLRSTQEQSNQLSPIVTNVNGFEMAVVEVGNEIGGELTRRQAIAKNTQGIIMLKGDPSFSSNDQILIDELVFYIKQNDLKA